MPAISSVSAISKFEITIAHNTHNKTWCWVSIKFYFIRCANVRIHNNVSTQGGMQSTDWNIRHTLSVSCNNRRNICHNQRVERQHLASQSNKPIFPDWWVIGNERMNLQTTLSPTQWIDELGIQQRRLHNGWWMVKKKQKTRRMTSWQTRRTTSRQTGCDDKHGRYTMTS